MKDAGPIARRAAADARTPEVLSVREEGGNNRGKYVETYQKAGGGKPGDAWCAFFVYYRLKAAAAALGLTLPKWFTARGYTPDFKDLAQENNLWTPVAAAKAAPVHSIQVGDLVLFYFANLGRIGHVGIVTGFLKNDDGDIIGVKTVEGNTGPERGKAVERNGDGVYEKEREWAELGARGGFFRIEF